VLKNCFLVKSVRNYINLKKNHGLSKEAVLAKVAQSGHPVRKLAKR
jgi:hypothetical protein